MAKVAETITYVPGQHDPVFTTWGGHKFQANVPKDIKGDPEGTTTEKLNAEIIELARNNPHFVVGDAKKPRATRPSEPKNAKEYRAYFIGWLGEERDGRSVYEHAEDLIARFARDRELQARCEVGTDDFEYLGSLFMPRLADLAKADELTEPQVAAIWARNGINQLPW